MRGYQKGGVSLKIQGRIFREIKIFKIKRCSKTSFGSTAIQEIGILLTLVYFPLYELFGCVLCPKGLFAPFLYPKRLFRKILG